MRTGRFADTASAGERYGVPYIHQGAHGRLTERLSPEKSRHTYSASHLQSSSWKAAQACSLAACRERTYGYTSRHEASCDGGQERRRMLSSTESTSWGAMSPDLHVPRMRTKPGCLLGGVVDLNRGPLPPGEPAYAPPRRFNSFQQAPFLKFSAC
jgi:hypothetical protein